MAWDSGLIVAVGVGSWILAQAPVPSDPPRTLPGSITGSPASAVTPVSSSTTQIPNDRFKQFGQFPPETTQCVLGIRAGADWLGKIHQANGRVLAGVNPALASVWPGDSEAKQAMAAWGLCRASRFMGDPTLTAKANQSLLTCLSALQPDAVEPKRIVPGGVEADRPMAAACLVLAIAELSSVDGRISAYGEHMAAYLAANPGTESMSQVLAMRAMAASQRINPADWKSKTLLTMIESNDAKCQSKFDPVLAGGLLMTCGESADPKHQAMVVTLADRLVGGQYERNMVRGGFVWAGAYKTDGDREPGFEMAIPAMGMIPATKCVQRNGDITRFAKYRQSLGQSLMFVRGLQATPDSASHFEAGFRMRSVVGGVRQSVTDGILRADATALAMIAFSQFAESGLESSNP